MSNTFTTGKTFQTGEQVTAADLNNAVNQAVPLTAVTDDLTLNVVNNKLQLKDGDGTNGVPFTKFKHIDARTILCNATNSEAAPNDLVLGTDQIIKCNDTGTGLLAGKIATNNINDDAVTPAKTSFIDGNGGMTLTGSSPRVILDDDGNGGTDPYIIADNSGSIGVYSTATNSDVILDGNDEVRIRHNGTNGITVAADAGKNEGGTSVAGAQVTGGLYVTGDVYVDDQVVADHLKLIGDNPNIFFNQDDQGDPNSYISGDSTVNAIETRVQKAQGDVIMGATDNITMKTCSDPTADFNSSSNPYVVRLRVAHDGGKNAAGTDSAGVYVNGDLEVTGDIHTSGSYNNIVIKGGTPQLKFNDTNNVVDKKPYINGNTSDGGLHVRAEEGGATIANYAPNTILLATSDTPNDDVTDVSQFITRFQAGKTVSKNASGSTTFGVKATGSVYATGDISADGDVVASLSSDERLKDNIFPIQDATSKVNKLSGNTFIWNDKSKYSGSDVGVIAQEVQEIIPSAVKETEEGYLKVEYTKIVPLLIESIKELSAKVQELEAKVK